MEILRQNLVLDCSNTLNFRPEMNQAESSRKSLFFDFQQKLQQRNDKESEAKELLKLLRVTHFISLEYSFYLLSDSNELRRPSVSDKTKQKQTASGR